MITEQEIRKIEIEHEKAISTKINKVFDIFELADNQGLYKIENPIDITFIDGHNQFLGIKDNSYVNIICSELFDNIPFSYKEIEKNIDEEIEYSFNRVYQNLFTFYENFNEVWFNFFYSIYTWEKDMIGFVDIDLKINYFFIIINLKNS